MDGSSHGFAPSAHRTEAKTAWHSMVTTLGPDAYADYHKLICGYLAGKISYESFHLAIDRILGDNHLAQSFHNGIIVSLLAFCDVSEQKAIVEMQKQNESVLVVDEIVPRVEPLRPADVHNRFLTLDEKREIRETEQKMNSFPPQPPVKPIDLNLQYFNYPLQLVNLQTLPTVDYLRKRLAVHAASKGLRLGDEDDWPDTFFSLPQKEGGSKMDSYLGIWAKIIGSKSLN